MTAAGRRLALLLAAVIAGAIVVTLVEGAPSRLPGVALGSAVLLHVERAGAIAAIVVALATILTQAARGRLPTQLSTAGLTYEADAAANTQAALEDLQRQIDGLQEAVDRLGTLVLGDEQS
jgi:hypothetical protein